MLISGRKRYGNLSTSEGRPNPLYGHSKDNLMIPNKIDFVNNYPRIASEEQYFRPVDVEIKQLVEKLYIAENYKKARLIADAMGEKIMRSVGRSDISEKLCSCYASGVFSIYADGQTDWRPNDSCSYSKLCPFHARIESKRRVEKYLPHLLSDTKKKKFYFGTLTVPNLIEGDLAEGVKSIWDAWTKFRRSKCWDDISQAYMANLETTWNEDKQSYNIHLHVLVRLHRWANFDYEVVGARWKELTGSKWVWWSKPIYPDAPGVDLAKTLKEVLKYTAKFEGESKKDNPRSGGGLLDMTDSAFAEWFSVFHGSRTMRTYKAWYGLPAAPEGQEEEDDLSWRDKGPALARFAFRWHKDKKQISVFLIQTDNFTSKISQIKNILTDKLRNKGSPGFEKAGDVKNWKENPM